ncbi:MAG: hypothetical protein B5M53_12490, partial [Candidatus Cloacimonas sp. 4484_209]
NWLEFKRLVPQKVTTVILPIGTMEAHGIIPIGTDNIIPEEISIHIAEKINALIAPTLSYGITHTLLPYPGSMTLSEETFEKVVEEIAFSLSNNGFETIIFMNGHGGHFDELKTFPGPIILYKKGEGFPKLDKRCKTFFDESIKLLTKEIKAVLKGFKQSV